MNFSEVNFHPHTKTLRQFAALAALFLLSMSRWQYAVHDRHTLALVLAASAIVVGALGVLSPASLRWVFVALMLATFPIGWLMSWVLLGGLYYLVFTPIAVWFRLIGRDALDRRYNESTGSYWTEKPKVSDVRRYFRQF
jgi:hypothetical protein